METVISQSKRKMWVIINYVALVLLLVSFYTADRMGLTALTISGGVIAILAIIVSFIQVYARTGLWRFVHTKAEKLDEREMLVTYESLRHAYGLFAVICLLIFLLAELITKEFGGGYKLALMPVIVALIYLAHVLPASVIAWTEREIYRG
ncbi:MAG: hypothetical protein JSU74_02730 [Candidatus Zixiibacteriota bacterium]|nr:MAG: hypothetical protein JSU74_02730 [candidate division Zixibacteria bacterium]